ncbi:MAG: CHY zinc finger protein [Halobacteriota archaeon]|uniref:CHY zinc finger protein n=1 Tax=Natronomonas sp. TaxID=2184060 RepID=UPI003976EF5F
MTRKDVFGVQIDSETRCTHYHTEEDIVALRFGCCGSYYACYNCHAELAEHDAEPWPTKRRNEPAAYCGVCETTLTAAEYMSAEKCPHCEAAFNPGCTAHYDLYFEWIGE